MSGENFPRPETSSGRNTLREILTAALFSATLFWGLRILPILGVISVSAAAVPLVRAGYRHGLRNALLASVLAAAFAGAIGFALGSRGGALASEPALLLATAGACAVAGALSAKRDFSRVFFGLCLYGCLAVGVPWIAGAPPDVQIRAQFDEQSKVWLESWRQSKADPQTMKALEAAIPQAKEFAVAYAPGLIAAVWVLSAALAFFVGRRSAGAEGLPLQGDFSRLRVPPLAAAVFVLAGAAVAFPGPLRRTGANVLAPVAALYFLAGLSIIAFFARRVFRTRFLRAALYVLASWVPFCAGTAGLGLFDWYFDFRKRAEDRAVGREK